MSPHAALLARLPELTKPAQWPRMAQIGVAAASIALLVVVLLWTRAPEYRVLFSNLADRDGGAIVTALTQMNVPYRFAESGNAILIPADHVHETRLRLAEQGLPRNGDTGFELLDKTRFGASQFAEQVNYQRALEGELAKSVEALRSVDSARIHLAMPRESLFIRDRQPPTASVLVTLHPGRRLSETEIAAITWLVSASVPNLMPEKVSVVDQAGRLLTTASGAAGDAAAHRNLVADIEQRAADRILNLLTPLVGPGNVRAQVSAEVDFSEREHTSEVYGPNQKAGTAAVRSQQTSVSLQNRVMPPEGVPGALSNQPPADPVAPIIAAPIAAPAQGEETTLDTGQPGQSNGPSTSRNDATINYEVDRTIHHTKEPMGKLQRLSAAVVVNYRDLDGKAEPLAEHELADLHALVRQAMGYSEARGDTLSIVNSPFTLEHPRSIPFWEDEIIIGYAMQALRTLVLILLIWLVWRKVLSPITRSMVAAAAASAAVPRERLDASARTAAAQQHAAEISRHEDNLNAARTMAQRDPRAVAMVVRSWMENDGKR